MTRASRLPAVAVPDGVSQADWTDWTWQMRERVRYGRGSRPLGSHRGG